MGDPRKNFQTAAKKNPNLRLLRTGSLQAGDVLKGAEALKIFLRSNRRKTHISCMQILGISKRKFYRFLAVSKWSKKIIKLIEENPAPLSQTALFKLADQRWIDARQLFNKLSQVIAHLRKRKKITSFATKKIDRIGEFLESRRVNPLKEMKKIIYLEDGQVRKVLTHCPEKLIELIRRKPGFQYFVFPKIY